MRTREAAQNALERGLGDERPSTHVQGRPENIIAPEPAETRAPEDTRAILDEGAPDPPDAQVGR